MPILHNSELTDLSQTLRKNMTAEERKLWYCFLRFLPTTIKRQKIIGRYVADFYIPSVKSVIELDGTQHFLPDGKQYDAERDAYIREQGIKVLRYSNADINQRFQSVCDDILKQTGLKVK